ncbi:MAG: hypothetical protein JRJ12_14990 [Deltaproteobacteria bacterium]|nr:hypothetical protein [Deltaproteobacteria bacterium]
MSDLVNEVDRSAKRYDEYIVAEKYLGRTSTFMELIEVREEEAASFYKDKEKPATIQRLGSRVPPERVLGSCSVSAESYTADLPVEPLESPFDVLAETQSARKKARQIKKIKQLINSVIEEPNIYFGQKLASRLRFLYEAVLEDPEEEYVPPESLENFIRLLKSTPNLKYPDVVLTPCNEISAQWRAEPNRHFAVVFLATGEARFVIFTQNPKDPTKIDRLSGITLVDTLMELVKPYGVSDWTIR